MAETNLARDKADNPIQVLAPEDAATVINSSNGTTVRLTLPVTARPGSVVEVSCSDAIHWQFGNSGVNATTSNKYQGPGSLVYKVPPGATHLAFITATGVTSAICSVTPLF
jgi:hypothetical protein